MSELQERLIDPDNNHEDVELGGRRSSKVSLTSALREDLLQDDTVSISSKSLRDADYFSKVSSSRPRQQRWHLIASPLLIVYALVLFLATAPGSVGRFNDLIYSNPALVVFGATAQVITFVWVLAVAVDVFQRAKFVSLRVMLPTLENEGAVARIALEMSTVFAVFVSIYVAVFWRPSTTDSDGYHVALSPLWLQLLGFSAPLILTATPFLSGWELRKRFWWLFLECSSCVVGWSPLVDIQFRHVLLTDAMTSAMSIVWGLSYTTCHFTSSTWLSTRIDQTPSSNDSCGKSTQFGLYGHPILTCLPFWLRLVQCLCLYRTAVAHGKHGWSRWQHMANAGKYLISILAVWNMAATKLDQHYEHNDNSAWETWHSSAWVLVGLRTLYVYIWDIKMDWALGELSGSHPLLRNRRLYRPVGTYYAAIVTNLVARCAWIATVHSTWCYAGCSSLFAFLEILRRGQWIVYRVEHEQLKLTHSSSRKEENETQ
eukprot:TRINITY_DN8117_c0_g1_i1.p1 TRINITY_DN8117_c0_g1~~TRINITY_DN8117_c0_g1_i1.p1  ORF type:complete len:486 (+),score=57.05 TRINITY_DN8117_c0_g1_i1:78-1535(+)